MNLQHERIAILCQALKLDRVPDHYSTLAQQAVKDDLSFSDFLEQLLQHEQAFQQHQLLRQLRVDDTRAVAFLRAQQQRQRFLHQWMVDP